VEARNAYKMLVEEVQKRHMPLDGSEGKTAAVFKHHSRLMGTGPLACVLDGEYPPCPREKLGGPNNTYSSAEKK
jgi:hypothetical protein